MKAFGIELGGGAPKQPLVVGGVPGVDLLPPEVRIAKRSRRTRRGVVAAAVAVVVLAGAGAVAAKAQSLVAEAELSVAQARTIDLVAQQAQFSSVTDVQTEIDERTAARSVVTSGEITWRDVLEAVRATLPAGTELATVSVESAPPMELFEQATVPLQGERIATVSFTTRSADPTVGPAVLDALTGIDGFVDAHAPSRTTIEGGAIETMFVLHLDSGALANRFPAPEPAQQAVEGTTDGGSAGGTGDDEELG